MKSFPPDTMNGRNPQFTLQSSNLAELDGKEFFKL